MNLIDALWIPVRRASGVRNWIAPWQITDDIGSDPIVALDAARPDFNGALMQFLIGLAQTTTTMDSLEAWEEAMAEPPSPAMLKTQFDAVRVAFELDGDGPRFLQDFTIKANESGNNIGSLLIEFPGDSGLKKNTDLFIKRGSVSEICVDCAATALFTLQTSATSGGGGGDGHFTSMRGGGPLTTLVLYTPQTPSDPSGSLWRDAWMNVRPTSEFLADCDSHKKEPHHKFPWMVEIDRIRNKNSKNIETRQKDKFKLQSAEAHPTHMYFGMPRRIWLDFNHAVSGQCHICGRQQEKLIVQYITITGGIDYGETWRHPLSPYYRQKDSGPALPIHVKSGGIGYRHWLGWLFGTSQEEKRTEPAKVVQHFLSHRHRRGQFRLWASGYETDKGKARCWNEAIFPIYDLTSRRAQELVMGVASRAVSAAEWVVYCTRSALKDAWFSNGAEMRGSLSFVDAAFWSRTEADFYVGLGDAVTVARDGGEFDATVVIREKWRRTLIRMSDQLFDEHAEPIRIFVCEA